MRNIAAAFVFFTRLPFWRLKVFQVSPDYYKNVINYWAVVGWLTAVVMAGTLWLSAQILPYSVAIILALISRLLITGALHEDGLADFFDGFGGGNDRERILAIMKDSHIGTYGVIGLVIYFLLFFNILVNIDLRLACFVILAGDPLCKFIASQITFFLPYARTAETSKSKTVYDKPSKIAFITALIVGILPVILFLQSYFWLAIILPVIIFCILVVLMKKKIGGYTGDCCGATFLLCELSFYLGVLIITNIC